jgi:hypothetical protein
MISIIITLIDEMGFESVVSSQGIKAVVCKDDVFHVVVIVVDVVMGV